MTMTGNICEIHGFFHLSPKNTTFGYISQRYDDNILMKLTLNGLTQYGQLKSYVQANKYNLYAIEMKKECPDGFNKTNNDVFKCDNTRGVLVQSDAILCVKDGHNKLGLLIDRTLDEDTLCCIYSLKQLNSFPKFVIGGKFFLKRTPFMNYTGISKWFGTINGLECIGAEMINWISNDANGYYKEIKVFKCRPGHGIIIRCSDIEMVASTNPGFIDLRNIYEVNKVEDEDKGILKIGRRAVLLSSINPFNVVYNKYLYGVVKWIGTINNEMCVGIELDYPCECAMNGVISSGESFECEPGCGDVCPAKCVTFDYYIYSIEFTVSKTFNIDFELITKEDWNQDILHKRELKRNSNIFIYIESTDRILNVKCRLKWSGYINGTLVAILEMDDHFPILPQQKIIKILKNANKEVAHIIVDIQHLFKYRRLKLYQLHNDDIEGFQIGNITKFGSVTWRGVDGDGNLFYGFDTGSVDDNGSDGTFNDQRLFECRPGFGVLICARKLRKMLSSTSYTINETGDELNDDTANAKDWIELLTTVSTKHGITSNELLSTAFTLRKKSIIESLIHNLSSAINIYNNSEIIGQLLEFKSFNLLRISLEKCPIDADNDKQLLQVAAEALKYGEIKLYEQCMNKCTNKDALMVNGETFVTHIIKEKIDQTLIVNAMKEYNLNLTKTNKDSCIPLTLACSNLMMDVMDYIVGYIKNQTTPKQVCEICMDGDIDTVFNCGHYSCKECSENIIDCHLCRSKITSRGLLYLN